VILSCPTCSTRYRHEALPVGSPARCSQCDRVFPVPPSRSYFVQALSTAAHPVAMAALAGATSSAGARPILIDDWTPPPPPPAEVAPPPPEEESSFELQTARPYARSSRGQRSDDLGQGPGTAAAAVAPPPAAVSRDRRWSRREGRTEDDGPAPARSAPAVYLTWLVLGSGSGMALAYVLGGPLATWTATGAVSGLAAGWGWLRWMSGRS
jgi:hypothetical protein